MGVAEGGNIFISMMVVVVLVFGGFYKTVIVSM